MYVGKTKTGYEYSIDERVANDQNLLDLIVDAESDDESVKMKATKELYIFLLGKKGYEALKDHVRSTNEGYCPVEAMTAEFLEIMASINELKN